MAISNYFENKLIDMFVRGIPYNPPNMLYVALCTADVHSSHTGTSLPEVNEGNYVRRAVSAIGSNWFTTQGDNDTLSTGTSGTTSNINIIVWGMVDWAATITSVAVCDASTGGHVLYYSTIPHTEVTSGSIVKFPQDSLHISFV